MSQGKINLKSNQNRNFLWIILGLIVIFIIGYAFWNTTKKTKPALESKEEEPNQLDKLKELLKKKITDQEKAIRELETIEKRRKKYFLITRFILVVLVLGVFTGLQYYWKFGPYQECHVIDNLRNYLSLIVICFTTIAFVSKGSLKSFKESIEDMAINWFFRSEETLRFEIQLRELEIASIKHHIQTLENDNT